MYVALSTINYFHHHFYAFDLRLEKSYSFTKLYLNGYPLILFIILIIFIGINFTMIFIVYFGLKRINYLKSWHVVVPTVFRTLSSQKAELTLLQVVQSCLHGIYIVYVNYDGLSYRINTTICCKIRSNYFETQVLVFQSSSSHHVTIMIITG